MSGSPVASGRWFFSSVWQRLKRKKHLEADPVSRLDRCLTIPDLTFLSLGAMMGVGIYVLSGQVSKEVAGPSIVLSFLIAGFASALSGLCYAEMGARVPRAGSAYVYAYVTMGEGVALVIGWNLILEYAIGTASVARAYSGYLDHLLGNVMETTFKTYLPLNLGPHLSPYPDVCAFAITLLLTMILSIGVKVSTRFNNLFTCLNASVVLFVAVVGLSNANLDNWHLDKPTPKDVYGNATSDFGSSIEDKARGKFDYGKGGFFSYGISGTLAGAATCFYGFVGFDAVATSGEEAINPQRSIPIAIVLSLGIVCVAYVSVASALTLMIPYYLLDVDAPLPAAFTEAGMHWAGNIVSIGALFGLSTSLLGVMFPLPRILYAMACDGILFRWMAIVNERLQTPLYSTWLCGILVGTIAAIFELKSLVDMMSIGTLMAYTVVSVCVLILRYEDIGSGLGDYMTMSDLSGNPSEKQKLTSSSKNAINGGSINGGDKKSLSISSEDDEELIYCHEDNLDLIGRKRKDKLLQDSNRTRSVSVIAYCSQLFNIPRLQTPTHVSTLVARSQIVLMSFLCVCLAAVFAGIESNEGAVTSKGYSDVFVPFVVTLLFLIGLCMSFISLQPKSQQNLNFKVPFVPLLPTVSVFINSYLMLKLSTITWIRFGVWMIIGFLVYGLYGWRNSSAEYRDRGEQPPNETKK